jgi:NDP-sugar pyrophosphorylase family protein
MQAVILAGGKGRRLRPYTTILPKPMMPIGEKPVLGVIIDRLIENGVTRIVMTVGYLAGIIQAYFGDGKGLGVDIEYFVETQPLGTAGSLGVIADLDDEFIVTNGDVLADLSFRDLVESHRRSGCAATICSCRKDVRLTLGVLDLEDSAVRDYIEKPVYHFDVSAGIYVLNKRVTEHIPKNQYFDFPTLMKRLIAVKEPINVYRFEGAWYDIGREEDYRAVLERFGNESED